MGRWCNFETLAAAFAKVARAILAGTEGKLPAIAVSGPFGAVKEQSSGLYAQKMAELGFLTIAFDPSYTAAALDVLLPSDLELEE